MDDLARKKVTAAGRIEFCLGSSTGVVCRDQANRVNASRLNDTAGGGLRNVSGASADAASQRLTGRNFISNELSL